MRNREPVNTSPVGIPGDPSTHSLLKRQLAEFIPDGEPLPEGFRALLAAVNSTYEENEKARQKLERALEHKSAALPGSRAARREPARLVKEAGPQQAEAALRSSENILLSLFNSSPDAIIVTNQAGRIVQANKQVENLFGYPADELSGKLVEMLLPERFRDQHPQHRSTYAANANTRPMGLGLELYGRRKDGSEFPVDINLGSVETQAGLFLLSTIRDITERKNVEVELKRRLADFEAVNRLSSALRAARTLDEMLPIALNVTLDILEAPRGSIWLYEPARDELKPAVQRGYDQPGTPSIPAEKPGQGLAGFVFARKEAYSTPNFYSDPHLPEETRKVIPTDVGGTVLPIRAGDAVIGVFVVSVYSPRELTPGEVHLLTTLSEIAGNAIQRTRLFRQTEKRLDHIAALHAIDKVINSSFDVKFTLGIVLSQIIDQLGVDAANVLLLDHQSHLLEFCVGQGFRSPMTNRTPSWLDESPATRIVSERRSISIPNFAASGDPFWSDKLLKVEGFASYFGLPLISKGQVKGVLEIFNRQPLNPDPEWLEFLETLAGQAVIAIDNTALFDGLQRSNLELTLAYDATIEGWSRALDLRDRETEGHTRRVTEMTVRLARAIGMNENELVQVRRGALLHDIGKMGVPDNILLKPDKLNEAEWDIMRKHPLYAYEMLSPIQFLRPALDIPYCHHEKWDGSGYPRRLKADQIPLAARLFAVVDIWDALRSDRPYRAAWPEQQVRDFIGSLAGNHLEPAVVEAFMSLGTHS